MTYGKAKHRRFRITHVALEISAPHQQATSIVHLLRSLQHITITLYNIDVPCDPQFPCLSSPTNRVQVGV